MITEKVKNTIQSAICLFYGLIVVLTIYLLNSVENLAEYQILSANYSSFLFNVVWFTLAGIYITERNKDKLDFFALLALLVLRLFYPMTAISRPGVDFYYYDTGFWGMVLSLLLIGFVNNMFFEENFWRNGRRRNTVESDSAE